MNSRQKGSFDITLSFRALLIFGIYFFLLSAAQCSFFPRLEFLSATPNIVLGALVSVCLLQAQATAVASGIVAGFLIDAIGSYGISLSPLAFLFVSLVCSSLAKKVMPRFVSFLLLLLPAVLLNALFTVLNIMLRAALPPLPQLFTKYLLPELLLTLIFSLPLFFITRLLTRMTDKKSKFKL